MPYAFSCTHPLLPSMDRVWSCIPLTGVVPKLSQNVRHITECIDIAPMDRTCARCLKHRAGGGCQSGHDDHTKGDCWDGFLWNGKPYPKRARKDAPTECFDEEGCEA